MNPEKPRRLIFLVTEDWYFWSHRLPMARAAQAAGFEVGVATRVTQHGERIRALGYVVYPLSWRRGHLGPLASLAAIWEIARLYRREKPLLVHHVSLKPAWLGGIAARLAGVKLVVSMVTGTGYLGSSNRRSARLIAALTRIFWPVVLLRRHGRVIVQNAEDRAELTALSPKAASRIVLIPGSGVDIRRWQPLPEPPVPVTAAYVGRMIAIKGIGTLVAAQQALQKQGVDLRLILAGESDAENPTAIDRATLETWRGLPGITWLGRVEDIGQVWRSAHIAVQPSVGGEGVPKSLLEAAAMGRPIVATDVPGNRAIARAGVNAELVPPGDAPSLAKALAELAVNPLRRHAYGLAGRSLVEKEFPDAAIEAATEALYRSLLAERGPG
ncbi:MAG TPA: glycosyltransferase family 4 protein [Stellaceae bacterium]|jgi:glycosyltransferase involved in cell wall biosynthesis|nr:glycosyltransferase family 4 protein [Stellaceae bacterium]